MVDQGPTHTPTDGPRIIAVRSGRRRSDVDTIIDVTLIAGSSVFERVLPMEQQLNPAIVMAMPSGTSKVRRLLTAFENRSASFGLAWRLPEA